MGELTSLTDEQRKVVEENHGLVYMVVQKMGLDIHADADLVQAGAFGLMRASQRFDPTKGFKFSTYASMCIKRKIARHMMMDRLIHIPEYILRGSGNPRHRPMMAAAEQAKSTSNFSDPSRYDDEHGWSDPIDHRDWRNERPNPVDLVDAAVARLPYRERLVVRRRLAGATLKAVADEIGVTRERVGQIESKAHDRLRTALAGCF